MAKRASKASGVPLEPAREVRARAEADPPAATAAEPPAQAAQTESGELLVLPVRTTVLFPGLVLPMSVSRPRSLRTLEEAARRQVPVGLLLQKDPEQQDPQPKDVYEVGTLAVVLRLGTGEDGQRAALCQGQRRFRVRSLNTQGERWTADVEFPPEDGQAQLSPKQQAQFAALRAQTQEALELLPGAPEEITRLVAQVEEPGPFADLVTTFMDIPPAEKQSVLECFPIGPRLELVGKKLGRLLQVLKLSRSIRERTEGTLEKSQRDYFLREQLRTIQKELGEEEDADGDLAALREAVEQSGMSSEAAQEAAKELARLARLPAGSSEAAQLRTWIEILVELPWQKQTADSIDLVRAQRILDEDHYGLERVKRRILEFLAVRKLNPKGQGPILCLVGPPGVGKTSLGQSIARAMGRAFARLSLGGVHDEAELRGHRRTYVGAMPGNIVQALRKAGSRNPVLMLDEVDKLGRGLHGDPAAALLEVLDPAQNKTFRDHYLGVPFDLSQVLFIATANVLEEIPPPLRDRMDVLAIPGYLASEKLAIARRYLVPRQLRECGLSPKRCRVDASALRAIQSGYTREAGVRTLERQIGAVVRHAAARVAGGEKQAVRIDARAVRDILGPPRFEHELRQRTAVPGVATGLAWTSFGGEILFIEATRTSGRGELILTGQLGEVMRESARTAHTLLKARAEALGVDPALIAQSDVHVHLPAGAIPKDGPSAGVALFLALASLFTGRRVRPDVAVTGEVSLRGLVLPVGGIREKVLAALAAGVRRVLLPKRNQADCEEVPAEALSKLRMVWLENVDQALAAALEPPARAGRRKLAVARAPAQRRIAAAARRAHS
jgi:ATP-dependent Lon protease